MADISRQNFLRAFPRLAAVSIALLSVAVLVGWALDIEVLKRIAPGIVAMNPTTAVLFLLSAVALWIGRTSNRILRFLFVCCASAVLLAGLTKFLSLVIGWNSIIDRLLFPQKLALTASVLPNWMAPNTAFNFFISGLALLFLQMPRRIRVAQMLGIVAFMLALLALLGYAYGVRPLYGIAKFVPMALNTAGAFVLLTLGLLFSKPKEGLVAVILSDTTGGAMARPLLPAAILVPALLGWLRLAGERAGLFDKEVGNTLFTIASVTIFSSIVIWSARLLFAEDLVRKKAEREHVLSEEKFRAVSETARDGILSSNAAGRITYCNQAGAKMFGFCTDELVGLPLDDILPQFLAGANRHSHAVAAGDAYVIDRTFELNGCKKCGAQFPVELTMARWHSSQGRFITAIVRDVSARVAAHAALDAQRRELARSNAELEQFAYIASHDLQEPLRMIGSYTQLLGRRYKDVLDSTAHEFIGFAVDGVKRMQALIHDLLAYSRVGTAGKAFATVDLAEILNLARSNLQVAIEEKKASVTSDSLPSIKGDAVQLTQLFQNLIANAIKFQGAATPLVHVSSARHDNGWTISVSDNGIGIAPENFDRIFQIFQRLHGREEYPGTGIGLAVCKKIVERHGGEIWLESTPGQGATFFFAFPENKGTPPMA